MPHPLQAAYDMYVEKLNKLIAEEMKVKKMLNEFATEMKIPVPFSNITDDSLNPLAVDHDEFVGKSASTAVGDYLEKRGKAAKWDEIEEALNQGGYDWNRYGNPKKTRTTIAKNTFTFKYIKANNAFGLKKWYPDEQPVYDSKSKDKKEDKSENNNSGENTLSELNEGNN